MKRIFLFLSILAPLFIFPLPVLAEGEFTSGYYLTYEVKESGVTKVTYNVALTNQTTNFYATEYTLTLPTTRVENIFALDKKGQLKLDIDKREGETRLHLVFNDKVVGKEQTLSFTLIYETDELAQKNGRIWEINIPKRSEDPQVSDYTVTLKVPPSFPQAAYFSPPPTSSLTWKKEQLSQGIRAAFGDFQIFNFNLTYHLKNPNLYPVYMEIALPPDTSYQKVLLSQINPEPSNVQVDSQGNWLARFNLNPGQKSEIKVRGRAQIFFQAQKDYPLGTQKLGDYLSPKKYWEADSSEIKEVVQKLKTPQEIYNFVVSSLSYNYEKARQGGKRLGAQGVLKNPSSAICMEFTDLFIALLRAAGIPAREVDGFAYTTNPRLRPLSKDLDILHAWPEYWDSQKGGWVMVDPTWAKTSGTDYFETLDFNHFVFVVKGRDSERPVPAGGYKLEEGGGKDVEVNFTTEDLKDEEKWVVNFDFPEEINAGLPVEGIFALKNISSTARYNTTITLSSSRLKPLTSEFTVGVLPPYGSVEIPLKFKKTDWLNNFPEEVTLSVGKQKFSHRLVIKPFFLKIWPWIGGGFGVAGVLVFLALKARRLSFKRSLR